MIKLELQSAPAKPKLRLVKRSDFEGPQSDPILRECRIDRIRWLARTYDLRWMIRQATYGKAGLDTLEDDELAHLHSKMEQARECLKEGISFEDADLVQSQCEYL